MKPALASQAKRACKIDRAERRPVRAGEVNRAQIAALADAQKGWRADIEG